MYIHHEIPAPVAQLDRAPGYEPGGLEVRTLSGAMILQPFPSGPIDTNAYIIACEKTREAVIVDPAPESFQSLSAFLELKALTPKIILLTHTHWDHIADVAACKKAFDIPVWVHANDKANLESPGADKLTCPIFIEGVKADYLFEDGERFSIGELEFTVIFTPGHSPGGVCFYLEDHKVLLSGDTLFRGTIGILSLPTAQPELMWVSLEKLSRLPGDVRVYPGHGPYTKIGRESWLANAKQKFG